MWSFLCCTKRQRQETVSGILHTGSQTFSVMILSKEKKSEQVNNILFYFTSFYFYYYFFFFLKDINFMTLSPQGPLPLAFKHTPAQLYCITIYSRYHRAQYTLNKFLQTLNRKIQGRPLSNISTHQNVTPVTKIRPFEYTAISSTKPCQ